MRKTFILGLGAQKSGTSWLFEYLKTLDQYAAPALKEFHVWDAVEGLHARLLYPLTQRNTGANALRLAMQYCHPLYFVYFRRLLSGRKTITSDISPSYAALPLSRLEMIGNRFARAGIDTKMIFFMRDPVDRIASAFRMYRKLGFTHLAGVGDTSESAGLVQFARTIGCQRRTRYEITLENLRQLSETGKLFIGVYEKIFLGKQFDSVYGFVGGAPRPELENIRVHAGTRGEIGAEVAAELAEIYRETYIYCAEHFPETVEWWKFMPDCGSPAGQSSTRL
jgi:hypothetical protein